jgi:periplasmic divalent cation tolerance protein
MISGQGGLPEVRVVLVTVPDPGAGRALARAVVEQGLAACGSVVPGVTSVYRWRGAIHEDSEAMIVFKTARERVPALLEKVAELHPHQVPEILALPVEVGHEPYLRWVAGEGRT